jgi:hypothetical protein
MRRIVSAPTWRLLLGTVDWAEHYATTRPECVPSKAQSLRNKEKSENERKKANQRRGAGVKEEERTEDPYLELVAFGRVGSGLLAV